MGRYISQTDVENRISAEVSVELMDDNVDGEVDKLVIARYISDAESMVESYFRKVYSLTTIRAIADADKLNSTTNLPNEIKRLCLDICVGKLFDRFPEYTRAKGRVMVQDAREELREFARGLRRLDDIDAIENTAQVTVQARSGDTANPTPAEPFFLRPTDMGDF